jgi:hypothetical protein
MPGQPQKGSNPILGLDCTKLVVAEPGGALPSNLIVPAGQPFQVSAEFAFDGLIANWLMQTHVPFTVTYYFEGYGGLPDGTLAVKNGVTQAGKLSYAAPETASQAMLNQHGTYKLTCVVTFGGPPVTAFVEGPVIQVL